MRVYPMLAPCAGAVVAHEDITPRKRAENALREQEAFFRLIAENLQGFVAVGSRHRRAAGIQQSVLRTSAR